MNEAFRAIDAKGTQDDAEDDDGLVEMTDFYDPIAALLSSIGGEAENLTEELRKYDIKYEHLSGLCDEDLVVLGLKNKRIREEVLAEIAVLPNQMDHYDQAMKTINIQDYAREILKNAQSHLDSLGALLTLTQLRLSAQHVDNVQIEDDKYASEAAVSLCEKLALKSSEIDQFIKELKKGRFSKDKVLSKQKNSTRSGSYLNKVLFISLLAGCAYIGFRHFKHLIK
ncbi:uncharacterized protein LOC109427357 [Aedes albopictus]|uniref:Uncharacterized protein n=1 Tax=Aedes albopictus TaxID=7160 RepID=A0ABM1Z0U8_AEDAL|nr:uncharacterized protein LOC109427357 [Aedes albopictus]